VAIWFKISGTLPKAAGGFRQVSLTGVGVEKGTKAVISANSSAYGELEFNNLRANFFAEIPAKEFFNSHRRLHSEPRL